MGPYTSTILTQENYSYLRPRLLRCVPNEGVLAGDGRFSNGRLSVNGSVSVVGSSGIGAAEIGSGLIFSASGLDWVELASTSELSVSIMPESPIDERGDSTETFDSLSWTSLIVDRSVGIETRPGPGRDSRLLSGSLSSSSLLLSASKGVSKS